MTNTTHFGYKTVSEDEKVREVAKVFHSVASKYDVMNDAMSGGMTFPTHCATAPLTWSLRSRKTWE